MHRQLPSLARHARPLTVAIALALLAPAAQAAVTTFYTCPSSGSNGNHDYTFNGFYIAGLSAANLHSAQLYYNTDTPGQYQITISVHTGSYNGPLLATDSKSVSLSDTQDSAVTWSFTDPAIPSGATLYFVHTASGTGNVNFNLQPSGCAGNVETIGTSSTSNGFSVAVSLAQNTTPPPPACTASTTTLCIDNNLGDKRFQVTATYATTQGGGLSGSAHAISLSSLGVDHGGVMWFFGGDNPELIIKVLNGCNSNNHFWVYLAALTNVGFHVTVVDKQTGHSVTYSNADVHTAAPVQDVTSALTCP
jgi:hypothetical protein